MSAFSVFLILAMLLAGGPAHAGVEDRVISCRLLGQAIAMLDNPCRENVTDSYLQLVEFLASQQAISRDVYEHILNLNEPVSLFEFPISRLSPEEILAYKIVSDRLMEHADLLDWDRIRARLRELAGEDEDRARQREQVNRDTKPVYRPTIVETGIKPDGFAHGGNLLDGFFVSKNKQAYAMYITQEGKSIFSLSSRRSVALGNINWWQWFNSPDGGARFGYSTENDVFVVDAETGVPVFHKSVSELRGQIRNSNLMENAISKIFEKEAGRYGVYRQLDLSFVVFDPDEPVPYETTLANGWRWTYYSPKEKAILALARHGPDANGDQTFSVVALRKGNPELFDGVLPRAVPVKAVTYFYETAAGTWFLGLLGGQSFLGNLQTGTFKEIPMKTDRAFLNGIREDEHGSVYASVVGNAGGKQGSALFHFDSGSLQTLNEGFAEQAPHALVFFRGEPHVFATENNVFMQTYNSAALFNSSIRLPVDVKSAESHAFVGLWESGDGNLNLLLSGKNGMTLYKLYGTIGP